MGKRHSYMASRGHLHQRCGDGYQTDLRPEEVSRLSMTRRCSSGCAADAGWPILSSSPPSAEWFTCNHHGSTRVEVSLIRQYAHAVCRLLRRTPLPSAYYSVLPAREVLGCASASHFSGSSLRRRIGGRGGPHVLMLQCADVQCCVSYCSIFALGFARYQQEGQARLNSLL